MHTVEDKIKRHNHDKKIKKKNKLKKMTKTTTTKTTILGQDKQWRNIMMKISICVRMDILREFSPPFTCHMSCVAWHMSTLSSVWRDIYSLKVVCCCQLRDGFNKTGKCKLFLNLLWPPPKWNVNFLTKISTTKNPVKAIRS